jgi:hypothetical protein
VETSRSTSLPRSKPGAGADEGNELGRVDGAPAGLGSFDQLER